jgi:hypothetical protein
MVILVPTAEPADSSKILLTVSEAAILMGSGAPMCTDSSCRASWPASRADAIAAFRTGRCTPLSKSR